MGPHVRRSSRVPLLRPSKQNTYSAPSHRGPQGRPFTLDSIFIGMKDTLRRHSFHSENGSKDSYQDDVEHSPSAAFLPPSSTNNGHHTHSNKSHTWYMISRRSCLFGLLLLCIPLFYLTVPSITRELHHIMPLTIRHRRAPSVLVTGAMGNIGKYVIVELLKAGYGVIALDVRDKSDELHELLDSRLPRWREGIIPSYKYVQGDIRNTSCISDLLLDPANEVRGVIHLAAVSRVIYCVQNEVDCADVNTFGTESILNAISSYEKKKDVAAGKLWLLFTSSREVFGGACSLEHPCDETAAITPINLYGKSKYESEVLIRDRKSLLKGYLILRLASVYGGLYDLPGRLIPQLAIKSMTDRVIDIVGGSQSFDFVHVADVVSSIMKGTDILMRKKGEKFQEEVLICSGHNTAVPQVIDFTRKHSSSQSPLRFGLADLSYPDKFVCVNTKMKKILHEPVYASFGSGLQFYLQELHERNLRGLRALLTQYCPGEREGLVQPLRMLDVKALNGCSVYITSLAGTRYLQRLDFVLTVSNEANGEFTLGSPGGKSILPLLQAKPQQSSGGYVLIGKNGLMLNEKLDFSIENDPGRAAPVSIWPYFCPFDNTSSVLPPQLPSFDLHDPSLYLLREVIPPEPILPKMNAPLYCRRIQAAIDFTVNKIAQKTEVSNTSSLLSSTKHELLPLCDSHCSLLGGCIKTGQCRCVAPQCNFEVQPPDFPFQEYALTTIKSFPQTKVEQNFNYLSFASTLTVAGATFAKYSLPKIHVLGRDFFKLLEIDEAPLSTLLAGSDTGRACYKADFFLEEGFRAQKTSLMDAQFVFVPFYLGWYVSQITAKGISNPTALLQASLLRVMSKAKELTSHTNATLVVALTHDFGGALQLKTDMRTFRGLSLEQSPHLSKSIVLSPMGDYNTLAYYPNKDVVIPSFSCQTKQLLEMFHDVKNVKASSDRKYLLFFNNSTDGESAGSAVQETLSSRLLFPHTRERVILETLTGKAYAEAIGNSVYCPQVFGIAGWSPQMADAIYAGCIPVLTSDVTHPPFADVLDWDKFSVFVDWRNLHLLEHILTSIPAKEINMKQAYLLKVRDVFVYDAAAAEDEIAGRRKGPVYTALLSLGMRLATKFPTGEMTRRRYRHIRI